MANPAPKPRTALAMASRNPPIDFSARRGDAIGRRSVELRELSAVHRRSGAIARRHAEISRLKAYLTVQYAATLCRSSDEQRTRWGGLAERVRARPSAPRDELRARRIRARLRARSGRTHAEPPEAWPER